MHGGAAGSGAPLENRNALKTGLHTAEARALRRHMSRLLKDGHAVLQNLAETRGETPGEDTP